MIYNYFNLIAKGSMWEKSKKKQYSPSQSPAATVPTVTWCRLLTTSYSRLDTQDMQLRQLL